MFAFVSTGEADCRTLREVAARVSESVVSCADVQQARKAIRQYDPEVVVCEAQAREMARVAGGRARGAILDARRLTARR